MWKMLKKDVVEVDCTTSVRIVAIVTLTNNSGSALAVAYTITQA